MTGKSTTTKIFKSGNSAAVRLPASFGAVPGTVVEVREVQGQWIVEAVPETPRKIDLTGIYGSCPGIEPIGNRTFEERPSERAERERVELLARNG
ncbi:AbrB/MazE/SpoVT family DNA-binding domain-containing protein [Glacieibacterium sp.]|uniref:AbrB/MazE/SpoVT family DNA-binding domain-containing protein n=1 Tax=Glacieibacterium sp. TaxID=2860237 RepID=UPI003AFFAB3C